MSNELNDIEKEYILSSYKDRKLTIKELARELNKDYETVRMYLVSEGYSNTKKVK